MNTKHPASKVVIRIRKVPKTPILSKPVKTVPCDTIITPDSVVKRRFPELLEDQP